MGKPLCTPVALRKNGRSLYMRIPVEFVHANRLKPGDFIVFDPVKFKIIKQTDLATEVEQVQQEAVA
jgi:hypothetical protein